MKINTLIILEKLIKLRPFIIVTLLVVGCTFLSTIIPPLKSPDEHDHIERAYHLSKGVLALDAPGGKSSGGYVDTGLLRYLNSYQPNQVRLTKEDIEEANAIKWSGEQVFEPAPGTGYYFPMIYLPQASALWVGELLDLTIDSAYRMSRAFSFTAAALLLYFAFLLHPPNPLVICFIVMPMTLFQFSSATIDGLATAMAIFVVSSFLKIRHDKPEAVTALVIAMSIAIIILSSSRVHTIPLLFFLIAISIFTRSKLTFILFIISTMFIVGWTAFALSTVNDGRVLLGDTTSNIIRYYAIQPMRFFSLLWQTFYDEHWRNFYFKSFIGILGWLDVEFDGHVYQTFGIVIGVLILASVSVGRLRVLWAERVLIVGVALTSLLIVFFAMLVTWTPHPAEYIMGVQGRYFLIPAILLSYAISDVSGYANRLRAYSAASILLPIFLMSVYWTTELILRRYYVADHNVYQENIIAKLGLADDQPEFKATLPLGANNPIQLRLPSFTDYNLGKISRLEVLFGTHLRVNPGEGELILRATGNEYRVKFSLSDLADNKYKVFLVPPDFYTSGEVVFFSGGGVSVWEVHSSKSEIASCVRMRTVRNQNLSISGCP